MLALQHGNQLRLVLRSFMLMSLRIFLLVLMSSFGMTLIVLHFNRSMMVPSWFWLERRNIFLFGFVIEQRIFLSIDSSLPSWKLSLLLRFLLLLLPQFHLLRSGILFFLFLLLLPLLLLHLLVLLILLFLLLLWLLLLPILLFPFLWFLFMVPLLRFLVFNLLIQLLLFLFLVVLQLTLCLVSRLACCYHRYLTVLFRLPQFRRRLLLLLLRRHLSFETLHNLRVSYVFREQVEGFVLRFGFARI